MKRRSLSLIWIIIAITVLSITPIIINDVYMQGLTLKNPNTVFHANDLLSYFGSIASALGTIFLGVIAIDQNKNANKLNSEFLSLEKARNMPPISIREVRESPPPNALKKGYIVSVGEQNYYQFDTENNLIYGTSSPSCLLMKNIGERAIISFTLESVKFRTRYLNDKAFNMPQNIVSIPLSNTILLPNEEIFLVISDIPHYYPKELSEEELFKENYTNRVDELEMKFKLENNSGQFYYETIAVHLSGFINPEDSIYYPIVLSSRITYLGFDET